jgi:hypothetical protein
MSDFRLVDGTWWNFDTIEQIYVKAFVYGDESVKYQIRASLINKPEDYEDNFQLFKEKFANQEEAEAFLKKFMFKTNPE